MNIAIVETEHFEGAFPVIKLFDIPENNITIITSEETYKRFADLFLDDTSRFSWSILPATGKFAFFYSLYKNLRKTNPDILYINTISNNHLLYALAVRLASLKRVVMTVHDINCLFESKASWHFRQAVIHWGKKWLIKQVDEFNVVADTMIPYLQAKANGKKTHNIPGAVFENRYHPQPITAPVRLVVPGSLDWRRRDYNKVFELAALAAEEKLSVRIILLGGYFDEEGNAITIRANSFESDFAEIICYETHVVDQDEFDRQMDAAHFVFIPSVINTKICGDIPETYGITKSSGNIFDVIKHAKPFIVPDGLTISGNLASSCIKYNNIPAITEFLHKIIASPYEYSNLQEQALANSQKYTIEKVRERNDSLFYGKQV